MPSNGQEALERLDSVVWSGTLNLRSRSLKIEASSPSVCRQGSLNISRKANAASMATSEYRLCPPRSPSPRGCHAAITSGVNQIVRSPRCTRARSYSDQFVTR